MREYKEKSIIEIERALNKVSCDICGKEIKNNETYYLVSTSNEDGGYESVKSLQSLENFDICSDKCLKKKIDEYMKFNSKTKEIDIEKDTLYLE